MITDGKVVRAVLGISYLESKQARALGINAGVLVLDVPENSPAEKAGLKGTRRTESGLIEIGDIILKVGDNVINTESDLFAALEGTYTTLDGQLLLHSLHSLHSLTFLTFTIHLEDRKPGEKVEITVGRAVAADSELVMKQIVLTVELQPSTIYERKRPEVTFQAP